MPKLHQIIAVLRGKKSQLERVKTKVYHDVQKPTLFEGIRKTYKRKNEDGDQFPDESKIVQVRVKDCIAEFEVALTELFDCVATQDFANTQAKATVYIGERPLLEDVPATHLLFLEKQLIDLQTFITKLPTVDPAYEWEYDDRTDALATRPVETVKTKKVPKVFELSKATDKHPAQVERLDVDEVIGTWMTITYSGAIKASEKNIVLERVKHVTEAVKMAREQANTIEVTYQHTAKPVLDYIFRGL